MAFKNSTPPNDFLVLLRALVAVMFVGLSFGFVMAFVSNGFVLGVQWLSAIRVSASFLAIRIVAF